jgi:hypothetical protein
MFRKLWELIILINRGVFMNRSFLSAFSVLTAAVFMAVPSANVNAASVSRTIIAGSDDAEESLEDGSTNLTSSDLELAVDGPPDPRQWVGMRFTDITIPRTAIISSATIQFFVDETDTEADTDVLIFGEKSVDSATFEAIPFNITSRPMTTASVLWDDIPEWTVVGEAGPAQRTPNLAAIIQEIINQPGWASGNALSILIAPDPIDDTTGERTAGSFEMGVAVAPPPVLSITFGAIADINGDGFVNQADYTILRNNMAGHLDGPISGADGDLNSDQKIDLADFRIFKNAFPGGVAAFEAAQAGVPEPSAAVLAVLAMGGLAYGRRRRTS